MSGSDSESDYSEELGVGDAFGRLSNSLGKMCLGLLAFPAALFVLGWNENHYVCEDKRILHAEAKATVVGCNARNVTNTYAFFSCSIDPASMNEFQPCTFNGGKYTCDGSVVFRAPSAEQVVEMYQCHEQCKTETHKNHLGQNVKTRRCTYSPDWYKQEIQSSEFHAPAQTVAMGCPGFEQARGNPRFPDNLDPGRTQDFSSTLVTEGPTPGAGGYTLNKDFVMDLRPNAPVDLTPFAGNFTGPQASAPAWTRPLNVDRTNLAVRGMYLETCGGEAGYSLGCVRISYKMNPATAASVIALVTSAGRTQPAEVPGSWGCGPSHMQAISGSLMSKEELIQELHHRNDMLTWIVRVLGAVCACAAVCCCLEPIAAAAHVLGDFLNFCPCGGFLDDAVAGMVDSAIWLIGCNVGFACSLFVISAVWIAMRPVWGLVMLAVGCCCCVGAGGTMMACRKPKKNLPPTQHPPNQYPQYPPQPYEAGYPPQFQPGQPPYGQPQYGQPQYGQPHGQYGQQYGQPQYGQPQYGQPQYGQQLQQHIPQG